MQTPTEIGNTDARFSLAAAQGALPKLDMIIKLFAKAFNEIEQTNHNKFTGRLLIVTSDSSLHFICTSPIGILPISYWDSFPLISIVEYASFQNLT